MKRLDELIPQYAENKSELDSYKKICAKENAEIKSLMKDFALQKYETDDYKVSYSIQKREKINEDILLDVLKNDNSDLFIQLGIIKTKEYIDFDALEKAIYDGHIGTETILEMDKAREITEVETLRVSKIRRKE